ncbi:MAG TPA: TonB family protein [Candidatus Didemnitutus sp.]|nr:TonB family protein [Candidatus Didemnitutus sp.]
MKSKLLIISATVLGGFISSAAFAATSDSSVVTGTIEAARPAVRFEAPVPIKVVAPTGMTIAHQGEIFDVALTIDASGKVNHIRVISSHEEKVERCVVAAVKQWEFKPAVRNGMPVTAKVILPVQLI